MIWYELIKTFKDAISEGIILNTSLNLAGKPLVKTPVMQLKALHYGIQSNIPTRMANTKIILATFIDTQLL